MAEQVVVNVYGEVNSASATPTSRTFPTQGVTCKAANAGTVAGSVNIYSILTTQPAGTRVGVKSYYLVETPTAFAALCNA